MSPKSILLKEIGEVATDVPKNLIARKRRTMTSDIYIYPKYQEAIQGLEAYSHIFVLFWMDVNNKKDKLTEHPRGKINFKKIGVLAARGSNHPNPVGLAVCELLTIVDGVLSVRKLDAYNGTKIIDIKPYDDYDVVTNPRLPGWLKKIRNSVPRASSR